MRTNIDINDELLAEAMKSGAFKTKKDAVEAGLKLLSRQAAYREILRWEGKLHWDGDDEDADQAAVALTTGGSANRLVAAEPSTKAAKPKGRHGRR